MAVGTPAASGLGRRHGQGRGRFTALLMGLAVLVYLSFVHVAALLPMSTDTTVPGVIRGITAGLFLTAGALRLARWRMVDDHRAGLGATVLLLIGSSLLCMPVIGPLLQHSPALVHSAPAARLLFVVPVLALLATEARTGHRRQDRPLLLAGALFAGWIGTSLLVPMLELPAQDRLLETPVVWQGAELLAGAGWIALAARGSWRPRTILADNPRAPLADNQAWIAIALTLMGVSEAVKAWGLTHHPNAFAPSLSLQLIVATIAVGLAGRDLRGAFTHHVRRMEALAQALVETQSRLDNSESIQRERIHDARSAVAGVVGAARLLADPTPGVDTDRLCGLMTAELDRLQESLLDTGIEPVTEFCLADVLEPVVQAHRLAGGVADCTLGRSLVTGRPLATATVLGNLLANVRSHAPGASVHIRAARAASTVVLTVDDDGPGIPSGDRARVLRRGVQGVAGGPGTGLGLHTATRAMAAQSGSLRLADRPGGGTRVILTLPAAVSALSTVATG